MGSGNAPGGFGPERGGNGGNGGNGGDAANENTPLLRSSLGNDSPSGEPAAPAPLPIGHTDDGDATEASDLDLLLSRSVSSGGPMLEPESFEHSMLRGPRKSGLGNRGPRRGSSTSSHDYCRASVSSAVIFEEEEGPGLETPRAGRSDDDESEAPDPADTADDAGSMSLKTPYLGGVSVYRFWLVFSGILATNFIACFDGTIMASSHPVITSYFNSSNSASWLSTAFLLTSTSFQPLLGRLSDSLGRKPPYIMTMTIFLFATVWCALAQSMTSFILARALCGLGAGGMMTLGSIIISDLVPIEIRGAYQSYLNVTFGIGSMLGAALGGAMADHLGWRWEFGVQVPFILLCLVLAIYAVPGDLGIYDNRKEGFLEAMRAFDFKGSILMAVSATFLILGLNLGGNILPWSHPFVITSLVIFAVCFPLFLYVETLATRPIMPLHLVRKSPHMNLIFGNFIGAILMNAILFNIPLYFQGVLLTTATTSGLRLVVPSAVASTTGVATGFLISWTRRLKWAPVLGASGFLAGTLALSGMQRTWPEWAFLLCLVPSSAGQGFQFPGTFLALLALWEQRSQAVVTSTLILWRSLGMVLGVASSSLVLQNAFYRYLEAYVSGPDRDAVIERARGSVEAVRDLEPVYREQVVRSYESALGLTFLCCAVLAVINLLLIVPVKLPRLGSKK